MSIWEVNMLRQKVARLTMGVAAAALLMAPAASEAQSWDYINPIPAGTTLQIRTAETIDTQAMDGRIFKGTVESDVRDTQGRLAIPRGATAELVVRRGPDNDLVLDLDSITVNGRRYGVDATRNRVGGGIDIRNSGIGANSETARNVGGGALLGAILGAAIGGGDGAAAGAAAGAAVGAGAQILTKGRRVNVPAETLLSYRLQSDMNLDIRDTGFDRDGYHYHTYDPN
jgi:hypothetical protein